MLLGQGLLLKHKGIKHGIIRVMINTVKHRHD